MWWQQTCSSVHPPAPECFKTILGKQFAILCCHFWIAFFRKCVHTFFPPCLSFALSFLKSCTLYTNTQIHTRLYDGPEFKDVSYIPSMECDVVRFGHNTTTTTHRKHFLYKKNSVRSEYEMERDWSTYRAEWMRRHQNACFMKELKWRNEKRPSQK